MESLLRRLRGVRDFHAERATFLFEEVDTRARRHGHHVHRTRAPAGLQSACIAEGERSAEDGGPHDGGPHEDVLHLATHVAIIEGVTSSQK